MKASTRIALALGTVVAAAMVVVPAGFAMFSAESGAGPVGVAAVAPVTGEPANPIPQAAPVPVTGDGLDWAMLATGLGAALGMVLLAAVVVGTRRRSTAIHA